MPEVKQNVILYTHTPDVERTIATGARLCYSKTDIGSLLDEMEEKDVSKFIGMLKEREHLSPFEHASFTFLIEGISRACSHQLVRHRIASFSQQSQRYVKLSDGEDSEFNYIVPDTISNIPAQDSRLHPSNVYKAQVSKINEFYGELQKTLEDEGIKGQNRNQDARFVLPNACETKIMVTMNCRALINFFDLRTERHAQWEIRAIANKMLEYCKEIAPNVFRGVGHTYWEKALVCADNGTWNITKFENKAQEYIKERFLIPEEQLVSCMNNVAYPEDGHIIESTRNFEPKPGEWVKITYLTFVDKWGGVKFLGKFKG